MIRFFVMAGLVQDKPGHDSGRQRPIVLQTKGPLSLPASMV